MVSISREITILSIVLYSTWFTIGLYGLYLQLYAYYILGLSNLIIGLFATAYFAVNAPSSIIGGYIFDRFGGGRYLLILALSILTATCFITPLLKSGEQLILIRGLQGLSTAIIIPLVNLLASRTTSIGKGIGIVNTFGSLGFMTAGLIGGLLADLLSYTILFYVGGSVTLLSLIILTLSKLEASRGGYGRIKIRDIKYIPMYIWVIYIAYFLRITASGGIWSLFSLFLFTIGATNILVGIAHSINSLTQTLLFKKIGEYSEGKALKVFKIGLLLSATVFALYSIIGNIYLILPIQVLLGIAWVSLYTGANVYILENTPKKIQGTSLGLLNMFSSLSWIIGSAVNGYISDIYGDYRIYIAVGVVLTMLAYIIIELYFRIISRSDTLPHNRLEEYSSL